MDLETLAFLYSGLLSSWILTRVLKLEKWTERIGTFACFLLVLNVSPVIISVVILNEIVRHFVQRWVRSQTDGKEFLIPHGPDAFWGYEKLCDPSSVAMIYIVKGTPNLQTMKNYWETYIINDPRFNKLKLTVKTHFGYYFWRSDESKFSLDNHLRYADGYSGGPDNQKISREVDLRGVIAEFTHDVMSSHKPQWDHVILPNFKYEHEDPDSPPTHYAIVMRAHHCYADATSFCMLFRYGICEPCDVPLGLDPLAPLKIPKWKLLLSKLLLFYFGPVALIRTVFNQDRNVFHGPNFSGPKYPQISPQRFDLDMVLTIKNLSQSSVTAVLNSCFAGGIKRLFQELGEPVPKRLCAMTTGSMLPYPNMCLQNRFSIVPFPLPTGTDNLEERLKESHLNAQKFFRGPEVPTGYYTMLLLGRLPAFVTGLVALAIRGTIAFTNVPGPKGTLTVYGGQEVVDIFAYTPLKGKTGISVSSLSYAGNIRFSLHADRACIHSEENAKKLMRFINEEFQALYNVYADKANNNVVKSNMK